MKMDDTSRKLLGEQNDQINFSFETSNLFWEVLLHVLLVILLLLLVKHLSTDRAVQHLSQMLLYMDLKVGASSREGGVAPWAVHLLILLWFTLPGHVVGSRLPWQQLRN